MTNAESSAFSRISWSIEMDDMGVQIEMPAEDVVSGGMEIVGQVLGEQLPKTVMRERLVMHGAAGIQPWTM